MPETTEAPETLDRGRYVIEGVLGEGGMATVYLARDVRMGVHRAIKLLNPTFARREMVRARFMAEAHAQAALKHPNVLMVHDAVEDEQGVYLVMDLAEGDSVARRVEQQGPLPPREVVEVGITIGTALAVAHASGLVHRDIKPANILIDRHGVYKLADFGIARHAEAPSRMTLTGMVMGTWAYMPPEQREDSHAVDPRSDIYAFGVTLYTLLTGRESQRLHNQEAWAELFADMRPDLAQVIQQATRLYPEDRYPRVEDMVTALRRVRDTMDLEGDDGAPTLMRPPPPGPPLDRSTFLVSEHTTPPPPAPRRPGLLLAGAGLVGFLGIAAVAGLGIFAWTRLGRDEPLAGPAPSEPPPEAVLAVDEPVVESPPEVVEAPPEATPPPPEAVAAPAPRTKARAEAAPPKETTIISVIPASEPAAVAAGAGASAPEASAASTGSVVVRTIPSGASVSLLGRRLGAGAGGAYTLPAGTHTLDLESAAGERTRVAVSVRAGESVQICYNFDTNSACGGSP